MLPWGWQYWQPTLHHYSSRTATATCPSSLRSTPTILRSSRNKNNFIVLAGVQESLVHTYHMCPCVIEWYHGIFNRLDTVKPLLRDRYYEGPVIYFVLEAPPFQWKWTCHARQPVLRDHIFYGERGGFSREVLLYWEFILHFVLEQYLLFAFAQCTLSPLVFIRISTVNEAILIVLLHVSLVN